MGKGGRGTIYRLVTGLGSYKKRLFMMGLLKKGAVGPGPQGNSLLGSPREESGFYAIYAAAS